MAVNLTSIYLHVVADVINNVRADFLSEGVDESVLNELQSLWELNMMQAGTIQGSAGDMPLARGVRRGHHPPITPVHDLNMPYEGETPTAELLFPPTPVHTPLPTLLAPGPSPSPSPNEHPDAGIAGDVAIGRPAPFMPSSWMNQKLDTSLGMKTRLDMNVVYQGGDEEDALSGRFPVTKEFLPPSTGKRKREDITPNYLSGNYFPQRDGAGDIITRPVSLEQAPCGVKKPLHLEDPTALAAKRNLRMGIDQCQNTEERILADTLIHAIVDSHHAATHSSIPQLDGIGDNYDDSVAEEDYNEPGEEEQLAADDGDLKPPKSGGAESDGSEPPLNEDDDLDDLDDIDKGGKESKTEHLVLAQFEKVTRSKNKWKCILKDGIMQLNNSDSLFSRANGEFEF